MATSETGKNSQEPAVPQGRSDKAQGLWRPIVLISVLVAVLVIARVFKLGDHLGVLRNWIESLGALGPVIFVLFYAVAVVAAIPGSALTVAAGALFGSVLGIVVVSIAATLGASLSFLIARYFARAAISRWLSTKEKFQKLDKLTEDQGAVIVALTRLVPLFPFNLLNYGFGLTRVRFWTYVFWSWLCMLPGTVIYVIGGDAFTKGLSEGKVPWLLIGVGGGVLVILVILVRFARRKLSDNEMSASP